MLFCASHFFQNLFCIDLDCSGLHKLKLFSNSCHQSYPIGILFAFTYQVLQIRMVKKA